MVVQRLSQNVLVSGQLSVRDMADLGPFGITVVVNHRPDDEEPDQPASESLEAAARAAGIQFVAAPVRGLPDPQAVDATARVLSELGPEDRVLMFCRSGMRSACAWAMAERLKGIDADELRAAAAAAGYDLSRVPL